MRCAICDAKLTKTDFSDICAVCQWHVKDALSEGNIDQWTSEDAPTLYSKLYQDWNFEDD